jgi:hypothetical protein
MAEIYTHPTGYRLGIGCDANNVDAVSKYTP